MHIATYHILLFLLLLLLLLFILLLILLLLPIESPPAVFFQPPVQNHEFNLRRSDEDRNKAAGTRARAQTKIETRLFTR